VLILNTTLSQQPTAAGFTQFEPQIAIGTLARLVREVDPLAVQAALSRHSLIEAVLGDHVDLVGMGPV